MITTEDEVYKLSVSGSHYRPEKYLKNYTFSKEILLDIFCSEEMIFCYEDYYYDDITINMIKTLQPHINISEFKILWNDLDEIRIAELFSDYIINIPVRSTYKYNLIDDYICNYDKYMFDFKSNFDSILVDYKSMLKKNKFINKFSLCSDDELESIIDKNTLIKKAKFILEKIPKKYSSILPL